jgi:hypothetical protein
MKKRVLAGVLWFYVTWTAWSFLAAFLGLPGILGPIFGAVVAVLIVRDPLDRIWVVGSETRRPAMPTTAPHSEPA